MHIISKAPIREFWLRHTDAEKPLKEWWRQAKSARWDTPAMVTADVPRSSAVGGNRIVFRISGNDYRLVVKFNYAYGVGYVRFIGTHQEYDKVDAERV